MADFDSFVIFADRRTGSNYLEANINAIDGLTCHGEAFNPNFIGYPNRKELLGLGLSDREVEPMQLLDRFKREDGLHGFRYFNGHEPRVFDAILADPKCAKIILTRNPLDSFISLEIARKTKQWKLTDVSRRRSEAIRFDPVSFERYLGDIQAFQTRLQGGLRKTTQSAFFVGYDELQNIDVMNSISGYLGCSGRLQILNTSMKKQNPGALADKVLNFEEMNDALVDLGSTNLTSIPSPEPRRGASVHTYLATPKTPLMYQVLRSGPVSVVADWMAELDGVPYEALMKNFTPKSMRQWKLDRPGHRCFTVVRHPVARAHAAFCDKVLAIGSGSYPAIRKTLMQSFGLKLPVSALDDSYDQVAHRVAFLGFLRFVKLNLAGETPVRIDPHWATQANTVQGFSDFATPDMILREDRLEDDLAVLAAQVGHMTMPEINLPTDPHAEHLLEIYDPEVEAAVYDAYRRDYIAFGFGPYV